MARRTMATRDAIRGDFAEVFVTVNGNRRSILMAKDFEGKADINTEEVPRLGTPIMGHKATTLTLSFSMTIYKCTELFDDLIEEYINTGVMPEFTIQVSNEDPASSVGRSTKIFNNCVLDGEVLLSSVDAEGNFIEQTIEGYCDSISRPERMTDPDYM